MRQNGLPNLYNTIFSFLFVGLMASCSSTKNIKPAEYVYFRNGTDTIFSKQRETVIQPNDLLSIQVYSKTPNQEQAAIYNMPTPSTTNNTMGAAPGTAPGYQVDATGDIEMPVIGTVKSAGLTIYELQNVLVQKLANNVKYPAVLVSFLEFNINVFGEVHAPGLHKFTMDKVTILDAIPASGDLTDYGKRDSITVIREEQGKRVYHNVYLRDKDIFQSPVYIMEPNDVVYVPPNRYKLRNLSINPDKQRNTTLLLSILFAAVSVASLVIAISYHN
ncbi:MAG TPA: polysaccharide biosynthesis/export family protein [Chitinophagaceae bacterium]|nr:polysaccharide biosynthesis/export family protein [Chitinophagaceae bacterium]